MFIVKLQGGLGNQLFQLAFAHEIARRDSEVYLDARLYRRAKIHAGFTLSDYVELPFPIASKDELRRLRLVENWTLHEVLRHLPIYRNRVVVEDQAKFSPEYFEHHDVLYDGYWQDERYFAHAQDEVRRMMANITVDDANQAVLEQIRASESVSVHVRRGDYLGLPLFAGICDTAYYQRALAHVREHIAGAKLFVFSDDLDWCRENLPLADATFVAGNAGARALFDLLLMSACKHHIIANSSFSWWSAYLEPRPDKLVIAPRKWMNDPVRDAAMLLPAVWTRL